MYLEVESANWGHYFYVSYWRRNLHGHPIHAEVQPLAVLRDYLHFSVIH